MIKWVVLFVIFYSLAGNAMNLDSLKGVWQDNSQPNDERMQAFEKFIWNGYLFSQPDSAFHFCELKLDLANELGMKSAVADALRMQGMSWIFRGDYEKAIALYNESYQTYESIQDLLGMGRIQSNLGILYTDLSDYDKALKVLEKSAELFEEANAVDQMGLPLGNSGRVYYLQGNLDRAAEMYMAAISYHEKANNQQALGSTFNNLAGVHLDRAKYHSAIRYYEKSLKLCRALNDVVGMCAAHRNISSAYRIMEEYEKGLAHIQEGLRLAHSINNKSYVALFSHAMGQSLDDRGETSEGISYFKESIEIYSDIENMQSLALSLSDLGTAYSKLSLLDSAMYYLFRSYDLSSEISDQWILSISAKHIAEILRIQGDNDKALQYGEIAFNNAQKTGAYVNIAASAQTLYNIYKEINNDSKALVMIEKYMMYRDSTRSEENIKELARFEFKYEYEKKALADSLRIAAEKETRELNHRVEIAQKETERNLYASAGLILLFASFLFYQRKANKNKLVLKEKEAAYQQELIYASINSQENERRRIARDLHDEVGAMLSTLKLQLGAVGKKITVAGGGEDPTKPAVSLVDETITNVRRISKDLLPPTLEEFGLVHALEDLADKVSAASGVIIKKDIQPLAHRLEVERELALYRVIQEMMNNALKHAEATEFNLAMHEENGQLNLTFSDNGKGFDLAAIKKSRAGKTGLGLKNLENRVGAAGGEMELVSSPRSGTRLAVWMSMKTAGVAA